MFSLEDQVVDKSGVNGIVKDFDDSNPDGKCIGVLFDGLEDDGIWWCSKNELKKVRIEMEVKKKNSKKKFRAKEFCFLNKKERKTRVIYTPQIFFNGEWCCFPDKSTLSELIECKNKEEALKKAKELYKQYHSE